jgi:hypothetical protein
MMPSVMLMSFFDISDMVLTTKNASSNLIKYEVWINKVIKMSMCVIP